MARDSVANVREQTDIVDLIGNYVELRRAGNSFKGLCPFHQENTPSFVVFPQSGTYKCFGCGKGGDVLTFYQEIEHVDFREALQELARRAGIILSSAPVKDPAEQERRTQLLAANAAAARFFQRVIGLPQGAAGKELADRRGIDAATLQAFQIGFAPAAWDALLKNLEARGHSTDIQREAGLLTRNDAGRTYDRFRSRLMFPIADRDGEIVGFGGRSLGDEQPKYLNSPQSPLFDKSSLLYGLHLAKDAIRDRGEVVVVEGYMDVVTAHQFGHRNVVAAMGTALTERQVNQVKRYAQRIVLALDADAAGQAAMIRGLETTTGTVDHEDVIVATGLGTLSLQQRLKTDIRIATMPVGKDPDELIRHDPALWETTIAAARPVVEWLIDAVSATLNRQDPNAKSEAVRRMLPILRQIPDRVELRHHAEVVARKLGTAPEIILQELATTRQSGQRRPSPATPAQPQRPAAQQSPTTNGQRRVGGLDNETYLIALFVAFRPYLEPLIASITDDLVHDGRNRELLRLLRSEDSAGLFGEQLIIALPDALADYAERLNEAVGGTGEQREETDLERAERGGRAAVRLIPKRFPAEVRIEAQETLHQLQRERFQALMSHVQDEIRTAAAEGDRESVSRLQVRLIDLSKSIAQFNPPPSPVFRDSRSPTGT